MTSHTPGAKPGSVTADIGSLDMTRAQPRSGGAETGAVTAAGGTILARAHTKRGWWDRVWLDLFNFAGGSSGCSNTNAASAPAPIPD